jgi:BirA family biotin operon repressor/biotin-[acetyl-CoA-carboxylase] ligase
VAVAVTLDGVPVSQLAVRWHASHVAVHHTLVSCLDTLHELAAAGAPAGTVVVGAEQTAGRGRDGRHWHSPEGGVWVAVLFRPPVAAPGAVAIRAGLVVADAADALLGGPRTEVKWPNDVYLDGRKLAGVLCEGRWLGERLQWLAVGIGVNVCNPVPPAVAGRAVSLCEMLPEVRRIDMLDLVVPALDAVGAGGEPLTEAECSAFAERHRLEGHDIRAPIAGRVHGVAPDGALLVDTPDGRLPVHEGAITLA